MIYLVLVAALDLAWAPNIWRMHSAFGFRWHCIDLPVLGTANVMALAGYPLLARRQGRPFLVGFIVAGLLSIVAYVGLLRAYPTLLQRVNDGLLVVQGKYVEWVPIEDKHLGEPGYVWRYVPLDALLTLAGSLPMLAIAATVGLLARLIAVLRRRDGVSPSSRSGDSPASAH